MNKLIKLTLLAFSGLLFVNCSGGGSSSGSSLTGNDYSGEYTLSGVECYDSTTYAVTEVATLSGYSSSVSINKNSYSSSSASSGCSVKSTGTIVFNSDYTADINSRVDSATNNACTSVFAISSNNDITPKSAPTPITVGSSTAQNTNWVRNNTTGSIGFLSVLKTTNSSDLCFLVYTRN